MIPPEQVAEIRRLFFAEHWRGGGGGGPRPAPPPPSPGGPPQRYRGLGPPRLFEMVRPRGYPGSVVQLRRLVRTLRPRPAAGAYLRVNLPSAAQAPVDWGGL